MTGSKRQSSWNMRKEGEEEQTRPLNNSTETYKAHINTTISCFVLCV